VQLVFVALIDFMGERGKRAKYLANDSGDDK
jgi:hypothetical protein